MSEWRDLPGEPVRPPDGAQPEQDPWADQPRWSEGAEPTSPEGTASAAETSVAETSAAEKPHAEEPHACAWCSTPAAEGATTCANCGAALAQREKIGDLKIPGLTAVDPALEDYAKRPLHLSGPSPSQGMAPGIMIAAAAGGPIGLAAIGGIAAVAAVEYMGARGPDGEPIALEDVGKPSEVVLKALERLEDGTLPEGTEEKGNEEKRETTEGSDG